MIDRDETSVCEALLRALMRRGVEGVDTVKGPSLSSRKVYKNLFPESTWRGFSSSEQLEQVFCRETHPRLVELIEGGLIDFSFFRSAAARSLGAARGRIKARSPLFTEHAVAKARQRCASCQRTWSQTTCPEQEVVCPKCGAPQVVIPPRRKHWRRGDSRQRSHKVHR